MPLVTPLTSDHDPETRELAAFFNETLGFCPNSVLTMQRRPAISLFGYLNRWNDSMGTSIEEGAVIV